MYRCYDVYQERMPGHRFPVMVLQPEGSPPRPARGQG